MNPRELLQLIHNRGEQAPVPARIHDEARAAAQQLAKWIEEQQAKSVPANEPPKQ
jgi:hypothetical protein